MILREPAEDDHNRSCPCKRLPLCLSSFTAAELGDVGSLDVRRRKNGNRRAADSAGNTPLHLAAQHGHVAATAMLLHEAQSRSDINAGSATPLHRASFSGAVATMRLLVSIADCDLLARDTSFGDSMTPLHKAASGGRYMAVQLLLFELEDRNLVENALALRDSLGHTALQTALKRLKNADIEALSVARWNSVAGGPPDWNTCVHLLWQAEGRGSGSTKNAYTTTALLPSTPDYLVASISASTVDAAKGQRNISCVDCKDNDGHCRTKSWESAFSNALGRAVTSSLSVNGINESPFSVAFFPESYFGTASLNDSGVSDGALLEEISRTNASRIDNDGRRARDNERSSLQKRLGRKCGACGLISLVVYPEGRLLVCRSCTTTSRISRRDAHQLT